MKLWIARNFRGRLWAYNHKPIRRGDNYMPNYYSRYPQFFQLPTDFFPEVTFENSPREVELKLI